MILAAITFGLLKSTAPQNVLKILCAELFVLFGCFCSIFTVALFDTWLAHRVLVGYMTLLPVAAFLIAFMIHILDLRLLSYRYALYFVNVVLTMHLSVNWFYTSTIYKGQIITNAVDQANVRYYAAMINAYEDESSIQITKLAFQYDAAYTWVLPDVLSSKSINARAFSNSWAYIPIFQLTTGRTFELVDMPDDIYQDYFYGKNWDTLSEEQIICIGDTAYIALY